MSATDLPKWVWDLVIAIDLHEDQHAASHTCLKRVLDAVPAEVRAQAVGIRAYVAQAQGNELAEKVQKNWDAIFESFGPKGGE